MTKTKSNENLKTIVTLGMLTAIAIVADILLRIPNIGGFLTYEPKDIIITIAGFIFGPLYAVIMSLIVCLVEMITVSTTGFIGLAMNFLSSIAFVGVATLIYYKKKTLSRAIIALISGAVSMIIIMLLWNYILTPVFMGVPREAVLDMMLPLLLPFNALKAGLNGAIVLLLYKPIVTALRKTGLIAERQSNDSSNKKRNTLVIVLVSLVLVVAFTLILLIFAGII